MLLDLLFHYRPPRALKSSVSSSKWCKSMPRVPTPSPACWLHRLSKFSIDNRSSFASITVNISNDSDAGRFYRSTSINMDSMHLLTTSNRLIPTLDAVHHSICFTFISIACDFQLLSLFKISRFPATQGTDGQDNN